MSAFDAFARLVEKLAPRTAIVLGSGLGSATAGFRETAAISFAEIPGLTLPSVSGHRGQLALGLWKDVPILLFQGRLHYYEGHSAAALTVPVRIVADLGTELLVLTNAAGGINHSLKPGSLMAIRSHIKLVGRSAWREFAAREGRSPISPYSLDWIERMQAFECELGRQLLAGVYAALTGPSYETPAEIQALAAAGVDAVGMSTALEAEAAAELGLEVVGISCTTNAAAGLGDGPLDHLEVLDNAKLAVERLAKLLGFIVHAK